MPDLIGYGHVALSWCYLFVGRITEAHKQAEAGLELYSAERDRHQAGVYGFDTRVTGSNCASQSLWALGYAEQSLRKVEQSLVYAHTLSYPFMHGLALLWAAICHCLRRDYRRSLDCVEILLPLVQEHSTPEMIAWATILRGWARSQVGERGASEEVALGLQATAQISAFMQHTHWAVCLAEAHMSEGDFDAAMDAVAEGQAMSTRNGEHWFDAELSRLRGELLLRQPTTDSAEAEHQAEAAFEHGIQIAREQQAKSFELRCTVSLAKLWSARGRAAEAHERLAAVYDWFTEGFDTPDLQEAHALLLRLA
jgi:predicted ATPase